MNRKRVTKGIILGIAAPMLVGLLFIWGFSLYMNLDFGAGFKQLQWRGQFPNVLRIGLLANLALFIFMIRKDELVSRGIVISTLALLTVSLLL